MKIGETLLLRVPSQHILMLGEAINCLSKGPISQCHQPADRNCNTGKEANILIIASRILVSISSEQTLYIFILLYLEKSNVLD